MVKASKRGRPRVQPPHNSIKVAVDLSDLKTAEELVPVFDAASALGVRHSRMDVLRAAISRGLKSLAAEAGR